MSSPDRSPDSPTRDAEGNPVDVVEKDIRRPNPETDKIDKLITPTDIKTTEQEADKINERLSEAERLLKR